MEIFWPRYNIANYVLSIESSVILIFFHTFKIHFTTFFPKILALNTIKSKCYWYKYFNSKFNIREDITNINSNNTLTTIIDGLTQEK